MIRTQDGYFADRVVYPSERFLVEARLSELRPVVLDLRHDAVAYAVVAIIAFVVSVVNIVFQIGGVFWGAVLGGSFGFFAVRTMFAVQVYRTLRAEFSRLCSVHTCLIMDEMTDAEAEAWMRRSKERARGGGRWTSS